MRERTFQLGLGLLGIAAACAVGDWVYANENAKTYWNLLGWASVGTAVGALPLIVFGLARSSDRHGQVQRIGPHSTNLQAGRDINQSNDRNA